MQELRSTLVLITALCSLALFGTTAIAFNVVTTSNDRLARWQQDDNKVSYWFHEAIVENKDQEFGPDPVAAFQRAYDTWQNVDEADIVFEYAGTVSSKSTGKDGKNVIVFKDCGEWDKGRDVLALTLVTYSVSSGEIRDADMELNRCDFQNWGDVDPNVTESLNHVDIQNIATHEIGHKIGLDHSSARANETRIELMGAMYYASYQGDVSRKELSDDDRGALRHQYPDVQPSTPSVSSFAPDHLSNLDSESALEISGSGFSEQTLVRLVHRESKAAFVARVEELSGELLKLSFSLTNAPSGEFDLVVSNAFDTEERLEGGVVVSGIENYSKAAESKSGGCGVIDTQGNDGVALIFLLGLSVILLTLRRRTIMVPVRAKAKRRYQR